MATVTLYVGANNATRELELERIEKVCSSRHQGFTIYRATGYWLGDREESAVIIIADSPESIRATITDLKHELDQDAIGVQWSADLQFV